MTTDIDPTHATQNKSNGPSPKMNAIKNQFAWMQALEKAQWETGKSLYTHTNNSKKVSLEHKAEQIREQAAETYRPHTNEGTDKVDASTKGSVHSNSHAKLGNSNSHQDLKHGKLQQPQQLSAMVQEASQNKSTVTGSKGVNQVASFKDMNLLRNAAVFSENHRQLFHVTKGQTGLRVSLRDFTMKAGQGSKLVSMLRSRINHLGYALESVRINGEVVWTVESKQEIQNEYSDIYINHKY